MRICHVTPHLPPDQGANALLPVHLGTWAREAGDEPCYIAYPARAAGPSPLPGPVTWIEPHHAANPFARATRVASLLGARAIARKAGPIIAACDLVHVHSNGLLSEVCAMVAGWKGKPVILTLYGTEIWHYRSRRFGPDLFTRAYRRAAFVTFYSHGLSARADELGLGRRGASVVYPPVASSFAWQDFAGQAKARDSLGIRNRHLLLNVKRLHPLAGQRYLIEAMGEVVRTHPDTRLIICGAGPLLEELQRVARNTGVTGHVTFAGLVDNRAVARYYMAADAFILPSVLEACPTVALEALACGTPIISADSPGGVELNDIFGVDVTVVPKEDSARLAQAIVDFLRNKTRTRRATRELIEREFRPSVIARRYRDIYARALGIEPNA